MESYDIGRNNSDTNREEISEMHSAPTYSRTNNTIVDKFQSGDKVFAKVQGFPYWPGRICGRSGKSKYSVRFYGSNDIVDCNEKYICDYLENRDSLGILNQKKLFLQAVAEIEYDLEPHLRRKCTSPTFESANGVVLSEKNGSGFSYIEGEPTNNIEDSNNKVFSRSGRKIKLKKFSDEFLSNESENQEKVAESESSNAANSRMQKKVKIQTSVGDEFQQKNAPSIKPHVAAKQDKNNLSNAKTGFLKNDSHPRNNNNYFKDYKGGDILATILANNNFSSAPTSIIDQEHISNECQIGHERISNECKIDHKRISNERKINDLQDIPSEIKLHTGNCSKMDDASSKGEKSGDILPILKIEARLISLDKLIRESLSNTEPDFVSCLYALDDVYSLKLRKGMLLKHPEVIDTLVKLTRYVGLTNSSGQNVEQVENMATLIRSRALKIYNEHVRKWFSLNEGESFMDAYQAEHMIFMKSVSHLDEKDFFRLT